MAAARQGLPVRLDRAPQRGAAFAITRASRRARTRSIGSRSRARGSSVIFDHPPAVAPFAPPPSPARYLVARDHRLPAFRNVHLLVNVLHSDAHRANIPLVKYLSEGREMEIALAPIAGTRLLAPFRLSVVSTLANLMIEANRFETTMAPAPAGTSPNIAHPSDTSPTREDGGDERCVRVDSGVVVCQKVPEAASKRR
jgi:hypothetical protein